MVGKERREHFEKIHRGNFTFSPATSSWVPKACGIESPTLLHTSLVRKFSEL
jgi:hypothetical protein